MEIIVLFNRELWWLVGGYSVDDFSGERVDKNTSILYELEAIETAAINGKSRNALVSRQHFSFLPSGIDFSTSEWSIGVSNGKTK